jgi:hypothetical protein
MRADGRMLMCAFFRLKQIPFRTGLERQFHSFPAF